MPLVSELASEAIRTLIDSYTAQVKYLMTPVYNVKGFGARGDGVTDDTAAIQAAIDAAEVAGGMVFVPPGIYITTATLTIQASSVVVVGIHFCSVIKCIDGTKDILKIGVNDSENGSLVYFNGVYGLQLTRDSIPTAAVCGIRLTGARNGYYENIFLTKQKVGILLEKDSGENTFSHIQVREGVSGLQVDGTTSVISARPSNVDNTFYNLMCYGLTGIAVYFFGSNIGDCFFDHLKAIGCKYGVVIEYIASGRSPGDYYYNFEFDAPIIDSCLYHGIHASNVSGVNIKDGWIASNGTEGTEIANIKLSGCTKSLIADCDIRHSDHGIDLYKCSEITVGGCDILDILNNGCGVRLFGSTNCKINDNTFKDVPSVNIQLIEQDTVVVANNEFTNNRIVGGLYGIQSTTGSDNNNFVEGNVITGVSDFPLALSANNNIGFNHLNDKAYFKIGNKIHYFGTAAPTTGTWNTGDIIYNTNPAAGGYIGWVCVAGGTPGTWKTFGAISA